MRVVLLFVFAVCSSGAAWAANAKVAVLEFVHTGSQAEWAPLGKGFQEMFLVDLSKAEAIDVVERRTVREQRLAIGLDLPADVKARLELGRKAGATHMLSGSFAVVGDQLTMQSELQDIASGQTLLTRTTTVETEAFFEAQKEVLKASITAMHVALAPRERAETGRLHTADLLAFQAFSNGLHSFDTEDYQASITSLRKATQRDTQFNLAAITLADYEKLLADIQNKASAIHVVRAEEKRLERLGAAGEQVEVIRKLLTIAAQPGDTHVRQRTTALFLLAINYGNLGRSKSKLAAVRALEDRFAMQRASDELMRKYHHEAMAVWPKLPVQFDDVFYRGFPELETFDEDFDDAVAQLWEKGADYPINRVNYLLSNLRYPYKVARPLHYTLADEVALHDTFIEMSKELEPEPYWIKSEQDVRIKSYRTVLRIDDSTRILDKQSRASDNEYALRGLAMQVETNKAYKTLLKSAQNKALMREWVALAMEDGLSKGPIVNMGAEHFAAKTPTGEGVRLLTKKRDWPSRDDAYMRIGSIPAWCVQAKYALWTGRRSDPRQTDAIRYFRAPDKEPVQPLVYLGSGPIGDLDAHFTVDWTVPGDFRPGRDKVQDGGDPTVMFLLGGTDLDVKRQRDQDTREDVLVRPTQGYFVRVSRDELAIVQSVEVERHHYNGKTFDDRVLASRKLKRAVDDGARVDIAVRGDRIYATVSGVTIQSKVKGDVLGFAGLRWVGTGYLQVAKLSIDGQATGAISWQ